MQSICIHLTQYNIIDILLVNPRSLVEKDCKNERKKPINIRPVFGNLPDQARRRPTCQTAVDNLNREASTLRIANRIGGIWMVFSMSCFAIEDALIKLSASSLPIAQIMMAFGAGGALLFGFSLALRGINLFPKAALAPAMLLRILFEACGRLFFVLAISIGALSTVTVILQATPIVVVAGAALFLGEKIPLARWFAIAFGTAGVLVVLQPSIDGFAGASLLAIIGMFGFAGRDLASRAAPASLDVAHLGLYGFLTVLMAGFLFVTWEQRQFVYPDTATTMYLIGATVVGVIAYASLMKAMRTGDVSAVAPFRYFRLIFGVGLGYIFFSEAIDVWTLLGAGMIVLSGALLLAGSNSLTNAAKSLQP